MEQVEQQREESAVLRAKLALSADSLRSARSAETEALRSASAARATALLAESERGQFERRYLIMMDGTAEGISVRESLEAMLVKTENAKVSQNTSLPRH